jgi:hypothetical protein
MLHYCRYKGLFYGSDSRLHKLLGYKNLTSWNGLRFTTLPHWLIRLGEFIMAASRKAPRKSSLNRPINIDKGGIASRKSQPLGRAPLREPYGARSGETPEKSGTPQTISGKDSRRKD